MFLNIIKAGILSLKFYVLFYFSSNIQHTFMNKIMYEMY